MIRFLISLCVTLAIALIRAYDPNPINHALLYMNIGATIITGVYEIGDWLRKDTTS